MDPRHDLLALRTAVPYIRTFKGGIFVVKLGGALCEPGPALANFVDQVAVLEQLGVKIIVVHGGGPQATQLAEKMGLRTQIIAGRRITDAATLEVAKMIFAGTINTNLLAAFRKANVPAIGLSGVDSGLVAAHRRPPGEVHDPSTGKTVHVDYGLVGDIDDIRLEPLLHLLSGGFVPVICSLASDDAGQVFNVNADTLASRIAIRVGATKYVLVTSVDGVLENISDPATLRSQLVVSEIEPMVKRGIISGGMLPKLTACVDAVRGGVPRAHIINGGKLDSLLAEVFTNEGCGTLIVPDPSRP